MVKIKKTNSKLSSKPKLDPEEQYWNKVDQLAHYQVADILNKVLPLPNLRNKESLNLEKDADYRTLFFEYENNYSEEVNLPAPQALAEEIAYEYLLLVSKSILRNLSNFNCHIPDYFENLTNEL